MSGNQEDRVLYLPSPKKDQEFRLHLDENISGGVARLLRSRGFDVTTTKDVGLRAQSDVSHMSYALQQRRIIVTRDRDFLKLHAEDHEHSGIVYWPHNEQVSLSEMQETLINLLQRIAKSPGQGAEVATACRQIRLKRRNRKRERRTTQTGLSTNWLPTGLLVQATVVAQQGGMLKVQLESGEQGIISPCRLPTSTPQVGDAIDAVTVRYSRTKRQLHLSMRRAFSLARTLPTLGLKQLRRADKAMIHELQTRWPVEIVVEGEHMLRIYGLTADAVRDAARHLQQKIPWVASAVVRLDKQKLFAWCHTAFGGGVDALAQATGTMVRYQYPEAISLFAASNRELDGVVRLIQAHLPDLQVEEFQAARSESLSPCRWEQLVRSDAHGNITIRGV